ncbi:hypothetical protein DAPPUDRAFT_110454 [Daphnia pulex]|uniref:Uncharacterized protein n=1 Tax=Daphnia pulex TaxID=6669 RepID=E9H6A8_DAPPU|nr:hypothetical protein DAPPUDRAFT_110454 [Daphnia pulex]|eukprot:EFX72726.1 hypothetical protein DAPPUDRAFT_110454 [Daphnia pulex]
MDFEYTEDAGIPFRCPTDGVGVVVFHVFEFDKVGIELLSPSSVGSPGGMLRRERLRSILPFRHFGPRFNVVLAVEDRNKADWIVLFLLVCHVVLRRFFRMFVASWSAISFPTIPACEGIHVNVILVPEAFKLKICLIISGMWNAQMAVFVVSHTDPSVYTSRGLVFGFRIVELHCLKFSYFSMKINDEFKHRESYGNIIKAMGNLQFNCWLPLHRLDPLVKLRKGC